MGYEEEIVEYLTSLKVGQEISRKEIIENVHALYGTNKESIIPSDYCYNIINKDVMSYDFEKGHPRLLEHREEERGLYRYLGKNYPYTGSITHKGEPVGQWTNGKYVIDREFYENLKKK